MPQMASFVVKNMGNLDIPVTAKTSSGGDGTTAVWRIEDDPTKSPTYLTALSLKTVPTADKKGRRCLFEAVAFWTVGDTRLGTEKVLSRMPLKVEMVIPLTMPSAAAEDYATVLLRTIVSDVVMGSIRSGYSPR